VIAGIVLFTATTAERFFRIDQAHEHLHYATDIFSEELFIVYLELHTEDEPASSVVIVPPDQHWGQLGDDIPPVERASFLTRTSDGLGHRPLHRLSGVHSLAASSNVG